MSTSNNGQMTQGAGVLSRGAQMTEAAKADLHKTRTNLESQLTALKSHWQGGGGDAFTSLHMQWNDKADQIVKILDTFEASLRTTETTNVSNDHQQSANVNHVTSRLGSV